MTAAVDAGVGQLGPVTIGTRKPNLKSVIRTISRLSSVINFTSAVNWLKLGLLVVEAVGTVNGPPTQLTSKRPLFRTRLRNVPDKLKCLNESDSPKRFIIGSRDAGAFFSSISRLVARIK